MKHAIDPVMTHGYEPDVGKLLQGKVTEVFTLETFLKALQDSLRKIRPLRPADPSVKRIWLYTGAFLDNMFPEEPYTKVEITNEYNFYQAVTEFKDYLVTRKEGYFFKVEFHRGGALPVDETQPRDSPLLRYTTFRSYTSNSAIRLASDYDANHQFALDSDVWINQLGYPPRMFTEPGEAPAACPVMEQVTSGSEPDSDEEPVILAAHRARWDADLAWKRARDQHSFIAHHPDRWTGAQDAWEEAVRVGTFARMSDAEREQMRTENWDALPAAEKEHLRLTRWDILPDAEQAAMLEDTGRFYDLPYECQRGLYLLNDHRTHLPEQEIEFLQDFDNCTDERKEQLRNDGNSWSTLPHMEKERMRVHHWNLLSEGTKNFYRMRGQVPDGEV